MARRSRLDIVIDVLSRLAEEGEMPPSRLATAANLPYDRLQEVLGALEARGLVRTKTQGRGRLVEVTGEGRRALAELLRVRRLLRDLGLA
ncbi:winged helix-turn-helix domain-containing protein [Stetteria hydrogenophila]